MNWVKYFCSRMKSLESNILFRSILGIQKLQKNCDVKVTSRQQEQNQPAHPDVTSRHDGEWKKVGEDKDPNVVPEKYILLIFPHSS